MASGIGERIRAWRLALGVGQRELADRLGYTASAVSQWETGATSPSLASLEHVCGALELELSEFWGPLPDPIDLNAEAAE